jgi:crotonobetainyl-CoA:carnitine CoA-transferase CaiB-like acyl-CoA transferase
MNVNELFVGLKVIDLSTVLAGPSVATFFAELGAEVIKIENKKTQGDVTRKWKLESEGDATITAYFSSVNYGKKYLFLDLSLSDDRSQLMEIVKESDVLISNLKYGDDVKFGVSYEALSAINPRLIYAHLSGYISQHNRTAYDVALQAETGYMSMNGTASSGPLKMPVALIDVLAAHQLKEGILCSLIRRGMTGKGSYISTSLEASAVSALTNQATNYIMAGYEPELTGSEHPNISPYGETVVCADGKQIVLAVGADKQFLHLCELLDIPEIADDPRFSQNVYRVINREALYGVLSPAFLKKNRDEWMRELIARQIPAGAVHSLSELFAREEIQSLILHENIDGVSTKRVKSVVFEMRD